MGKRIERLNKKKQKAEKIKLLAIISIFIIIIVFSAIYIFNWLRENQKNKNIMENITEEMVGTNIIENTPNDENFKAENINIENLKNKNPDTVGWIKVNGTKIEYPVVKTKDNDFYMNHSFDKNYNSSGWIFMDCLNKFDGTDKNIVIYGHNRRNDSMFGTLKNILTTDWQENVENHKITLITESGKTNYQVFSVYRIEVEDYYITTNFSNNQDYNRFIKTIKTRSVKDFQVEVTEKDQILTLSTCADNNKYRVVLHAVKTKL